MDFTSDWHRFCEFLNRVKAVGGYDECEDLLGGLEQALALSWRNNVRTLYIVCDAPCHGSMYHGGLAFDEYPNVPHHLQAHNLFRKLFSSSIFPEGLKVGTSWKHGRHVLHMMQKFREIWKSISGRQFPVQDLQNQTSLFSDSISGSLHNAVQKFCEDMLCLDLANLSSDVHSGVEVAGMLGTLQAESRNLLSRMLASGQVNLTLKEVTMQIARAYFNQEGNNKFVFHCRNIAEPEKRLVAKVYNTEQRARSRPFYLQELRANVEAQMYVKDFNQVRASDVHIVHVQQEYFCAQEPHPRHHRLQHYLIEEHLDGPLQKFNSNSGWVCQDAERGVAEVAQAFSHWTYKHSNRKLIFVDVQGAHKDGRLYIHDLARHSTTKLGHLEPMNHGQVGIAAFFKTHTCNETCQKLKLQSCVPRSLESDLPVTRESLLSVSNPVTLKGNNFVPSISEEGEYSDEEMQ